MAPITAGSDGSGGSGGGGSGGGISSTPSPGETPAAVGALSSSVPPPAHLGYVRSAKATPHVAQVASSAADTSSAVHVLRLCRVLAFGGTYISTNTDVSIDSNSNITSTWQVYVELGIDLRGLNGHSAWCHWHWYHMSGPVLVCQSALGPVYKPDLGPMVFF